MCSRSADNETLFEDLLRQGQDFAGYYTRKPFLHLFLLTALLIHVSVRLAPLTILFRIPILAVSFYNSHDKQTPLIAVETNKTTKYLYK